MRNPASTLLRALDAGVPSAVAVTVAGMDLGAVLVRAMPVRGVVEAIAEAAMELLGGKTARRRWRGDGRCWIEVRGLSEREPDHDAGPAAGSLSLLGALSTPGVSQLLGGTPLGPIGWWQAWSTAVGSGARRPFAAGGRRRDDQPTISMTPRRHSTAYNSRNGTVSTCVSAPVNGSEPMPISVLITSDTLRTSGVEFANTR